MQMIYVRDTEGYESTHYQKEELLEPEVANS